MKLIATYTKDGEDKYAACPDPVAGHFVLVSRPPTTPAEWQAVSDALKPIETADGGMMDPMKLTGSFLENVMGATVTPVVEAGDVFVAKEDGTMAYNRNER